MYPPYGAITRFFPSDEDANASQHPDTGNVFWVHVAPESIDAYMYVPLLPAINLLPSLELTIPLQYPEPVEDCVHVDPLFVEV